MLTVIFAYKLILSIKGNKNVRLSDFIFIRQCAVCKRTIKYGVVCPMCTCDLKELLKYDTRTEFDGKSKIECHFAFRYKDNETIKKFVFSLKEDATNDLFNLCSKIYITLCDKIDVGEEKVFITHIPRSRKNLHKYGYDQSKICAKLVAKKSDKRFEYKNLLTRKFSSTEQKYLNLEQRIQNTNNKFSLRRFVKKNIKPDIIIIIDDVVTTANSVIECARVLRKVYGENIRIYGVFLASN